jgi:hypothetical protein
LTPSVCLPAVGIHLPLRGRQRVAVPVWGFHGETDVIAEYDLIEGAVRDYETLCQTTIERTAYPDTGHLGAYERAYRDAALYDWMLSHTLSGR